MTGSRVFDVRRFLGFPVYVDTSVGLVSGVLRCVDLEGCLVLKTVGSWSLIRQWRTVKRR